MFIYEFTTWGDWESDNKLFSIKEIEVEEKPKCYIGKGVRALKGDIDKLQSGYGCKMYRLDNDPKPYISAVIERKKGKIESLEHSLNMAKNELKKWEALKGGTE